MPKSHMNRRALLVSVGASSLVAACGGSGGGDEGSTFVSSSSSSSTSASSSSSSSTSSSSNLPDPSTAQALKTYFASNFKIGMAADPGWATQPITNAILLKHANSITAESVMKANPIGVSAGVYDFTQADLLVNFCQANNIALRGHNLVWYQTAPSWFFAGDTTSSSYQSIVTQRLQTYITDVVTHFKGKVYCWDVVNECTSDDASSNYRTNSPWYTALGPAYIEIALRAAYAADPTVPLFINEYSTEDPAKRARLLAIVADLKSKGVPLNGIGHQLHINTSYPAAAAVDQALSDVEAAGLINHVTELDVSLYNDPSSCYSTPASGCLLELEVGTSALATALQAQALQYRAMYNVFKAHTSVKSVTTWGAADNHTWLDSFPITRNNYPLLFDTAGNPKSAFWAITDPSFVP